MVPVAAPVSADETEALKAEITKAVEKVQEAGKTARNSPQSQNTNMTVEVMILNLQKSGG